MIGAVSMRRPASALKKAAPGVERHKVRHANGDRPPWWRAAPLVFASHKARTRSFVPVRIIALPV